MVVLSTTAVAKAPQARGGIRVSRVAAATTRPQRQTGAYRTKPVRYANTRQPSLATTHNLFIAQQKQ